MSGVTSAAIFSRSMPGRSRNSAIGIPSTPIIAAPCASSTPEISLSKTSVNISSPLDADQPLLQAQDDAMSRVGGGCAVCHGLGPRRRRFGPQPPASALLDLQQAPPQCLVVGIGP